MSIRKFDPLASTPLLYALSIAHVLMTLLMHRFIWLVPIQIVLIIAWALWAVIRKWDAGFLGALAYIVGSEIAWRILDPLGDLPYEIAKYALIALSGVWLIYRRPRLSLLPILYFVLLLPSIWLTVQHITLLEEARQQVVFNLAGPCALACMVLVCANIRLTRDELWRVFLALILPMLCVATLLLRQRIASKVPLWDLFPARQLSTANSFASNQISTLLSLGLLLIWNLVLFARLNLRQMAVFGLIGLAFIITILMSFTRGGIVIAAISMVAAALPLMLGGQHGKRIMMLLGAIFGVMLLIFAVVSVITKGTLLERYTNYGVSGRDVWAVDDLKMFVQNPLLGVGPGVGMEYRTMRGSRQWPAHTEFTRMLGEHGIFGFLSLGLLILMGWRHYRAAGDVTWRSIIVGLLVWTALYMAHSATRLAAPSLVFGVTAIRLVDSTQDHSM